MPATPRQPRAERGEWHSAPRSAPSTLSVPTNRDGSQRHVVAHCATIRASKVGGHAEHQCRANLAHVCGDMLLSSRGGSWGVRAQEPKQTNNRAGLLRGHNMCRLQDPSLQHRYAYARPVFFWPSGLEVVAIGPDHALLQSDEVAGRRQVLHQSLRGAWGGASRSLPEPDQR